MTKPYKHLLDKDDLKHLRTWGLTTMVKIKKQMRRLIRDRKTTVHEPCYECKCIARKLGLKV